MMATTWRQQFASHVLLWLAPSSLLGGLSVVVCFYCFLCWLSLGRSCYLYPSDMRDPCKGKVCSFGASCVASLDGLTARCQCPERCNSFGDAVGSEPICGSDGQNYESLCEMKKKACEEMKEIEKIYDGRCGKCVPIQAACLRNMSMEFFCYGCLSAKCEMFCLFVFNSLMSGILSVF